MEKGSEAWKGGVRAWMAAPVSRCSTRPDAATALRSRRIFFRLLSFNSAKKASKVEYPWFCQWY